MGADGRSGDVFIGSVLDEIIFVVSEYSVLRSLGYFCLLSALSCGFRWRGDMGSPKNSENTDIFSYVKEA